MSLVPFKGYMGREKAAVRLPGTHPCRGMEFWNGVFWGRARVWGALRSHADCLVEVPMAGNKRTSQMRLRRISIVPENFPLSPAMESSGRDLQGFPDLGLTWQREAENCPHSCAGVQRIMSLPCKRLTLSLNLSISVKTRKGLSSILL